MIYASINDDYSSCYDGCYFEISVIRYTSIFGMDLHMFWGFYGEHPNLYGEDPKMNLHFMRIADKIENCFALQMTGAIL